MFILLHNIANKEQAPSIESVAKSTDDFFVIKQEENHTYDPQLTLCRWETKES